MLKERFPSHTYSMVQLEDLFDYDTLSGPDGIADGITPIIHNDVDKNHALETLLAGLPSSTSRADLIGILRSRLINAFAKARDCESILYGDSTTRLAERILSETAKGRGVAIPWLTEDGQSPHGIKIVYPMRDLLRKEITAYARMTTPSLTPLIAEGHSSESTSASSKDNTIEELMGQYFDSVEQNFPSIVANVVRTSSRLIAPPSERGRLCQLCRLPVARGTDGLHWCGEQESADGSTRDISDKATERLCYGCARSTLNP